MPTRQAIGVRLAALRRLGSRRQRIREDVIEDVNGCWCWTGNLNRDGYAYFKFDGRFTSVHRASYEEFVGSIPDGMDIDHLCRVRDCVNPDHLEPVSHVENCARGSRAQATHCMNGHEFTEVNTYRRKDGRSVNSRRCRQCLSAAQRRCQARKREKAGAL